MDLLSGEEFANWNPNLRLSYTSKTETGFFVNNSNVGVTAGKSVESKIDKDSTTAARHDNDNIFVARIDKGINSQNVPNNKNFAAVVHVTKRE
jgi:hypothetical protein